jgi:hypothetical protein
MKEKIRGKPAERKFLTVETESRSEALTKETVRLPQCEEKADRLQ